MAEKKNKIIERAKVEMNYLTGDAEVKRLAELREKWEMDYNSGIDYAKTEGRKEGNKEAKKEMAKRMKEDNIDIDIIVKYTRLTKEEIEKI